MSIEIYLKPILGVGGCVFQRGDNFCFGHLSFKCVWFFAFKSENEKLDTPHPFYIRVMRFRYQRCQLCLYSELFTDLGRCYHDCQGVRVFGCVILSNKLIPHKLFISVITELQLVLSIDLSICKLPHVYAPVGSHNIMKHRVNIPLYLQVFFVVFDSSKSTCVIYLIWQGQITFRYFTSSGHKRGASGGGRWPCQRRSLYVKFRDLGWQVKVLNGFPRNKQIFYIKILHIKAWSITNAKICLTH